jgi:hypothetical protein
MRPKGVKIITQLKVVYYQYVEKYPTKAGERVSEDVLGDFSVLMGEIARLGPHKALEGVEDGGRRERAQVVAAGQQHECGLGRYEAAGGIDFGGRTEGVAGAVDEEGGAAEFREVCGAEGFRPARRVQRIGEEQEPGRDAGSSGCEHGCLASAIGMAAEEELAGHEGA